MNFKNKRQSAVRGRSSALIVTIVVHVVFFLIAGTYVAMEVIERQEAKFEGKQIVRPKMKLKKLQVPVKIEQKVRRQAPKLNQRVTAAPRVNVKSVDFKLPSVAGMGGGGVNLSGAGLGGSLGFASTQLNLFGLRSKGEKMVFLLDTNRSMLLDEIGGIPAYKIIKDELSALIGRLPPTALFNVIVFDNGTAAAFSRELSPATDANIEKIKTWLSSLNSDKRRIGISTLPTPRYYMNFKRMAPIYNTQAGWLAGVSYAVKKGADSIYWLGSTAYIRSMQKNLWSDCERGKPLKYSNGWAPRKGGGGIDYKAYGMDRWNKLVDAAYKKHKEENERRLKRGKPVRVLRSDSDRVLVQTYFPAATLPAAKPTKSKPELPRYYTGADVADYIHALGATYSSQDRRAVSIGLKKQKLSVNIIHFVPANKTTAPLKVLKDLARKMNGKYLQIRGLKAIQSAAESN